MLLDVMDYSKGKIYVIRNHVNSLVYVGSTTQPLYKRFSCHKATIDNLKKKHKIHDVMKELGVENFYIELVEDYPCKSKDELRAREGHYIRQFDSYNNGYNCMIAGRKHKDYYIDNIQKIKEKDKKYHEENKEKRNQYSREYREKNKEELKLKRVEYKNKNKERDYKKYDCECGGKYVYKSKHVHFKTKKHQDYINL